MVEHGDDCVEREHPDRLLPTAWYRGHTGERIGERGGWREGGGRE